MNIVISFKRLIKKIYDLVNCIIRDIKCNFFYVSGIYNLILKIKKKKGIKLIILAYHSVTKDKVRFEGLQVSIENFEKQIRFLKTNFDIISIEKAMKYIEDHSSKILNKLVITFDDGYKDNFDIVYPILKKYEVPFTIFLTTDPIENHDLIWTNKLRDYIEQSNMPILKIGEKDSLNIATDIEKEQAINYLKKKLKTVENIERIALLNNIYRQIGYKFFHDKCYEMLSVEQIKILSRNGVSFHSHSVSHPIVSRLKKTEFEYELLESREKIYQWTGNRPVYFAYPNGKPTDFTEESKELLSNMGYKAAFTLIRGTNDNLTDRYEMKRIPVKNHDLAKFINYLFQYI